MEWCDENGIDFVFGLAGNDCSAVLSGPTPTMCGCVAQRQTRQRSAATPRRATVRSRGMSIGASPRGSRPLSISAMCHWQSSPPQGTLLKIAARITETASSVHIAFAAACPEADLFPSIARSLQPAGP